MDVELIDVTLTHPNGQRAVDRLSLAIRGGERVTIIGPVGCWQDQHPAAHWHRDPAHGRHAAARRCRSLASATGGAAAAAFANRHDSSGPAIAAATAPRDDGAGRPARQWKPLWRSLASLDYPLDIAGAEAALARMDLADRLFDRCDRLSGGQLQRVGVARTLYQAPDLVCAFH